MAGIQITSGFQLNGALPLDLRIIQSTLTSRDAIPSNQRYLGMEVYVVADKTKYILEGGVSNSNWVKATADLSGVVHDYNIVLDVADDPATILTPANGDKYLIGTSSTAGVFVGHEGEIAVYNDGVWKFIPKREGLKIYNVAAHKAFICNNILAWVEDLPTIDHSKLINVQGGSVTEQYHLTQAQHDSLIGLKTDADYVHATGAVTEDITGDKTFKNNVVIDGNLQIKGTQTSVNTTDLEVKDNMIVINKEATTHTGVTLGTAGIEIDRGDAVEGNAKIIYDEADDNFKAGLGTDLKVIGRIDDADLTSTTKTLSSKNIIDTITAKVSASQVQEFVANGAISANKVVYLDSTGKAAVADSTVLTCSDRILGIAMNTVADTETVKVAKIGTVTGLSALDASKGLFLSTTGDVTQVVPVTGFIHKIGIVKSPTEFVIDIADYSVLL